MNFQLALARKWPDFHQFLLISTIFFFGAFGLAKSSLADTHTAATCSAADVSAAIAAAGDGDTVTVPAGASCSWSAGVTIWTPNIKLVGSGIDSTIISNGTLNINATGFSVTGFTFSDTSNSITVTDASHGVIAGNKFVTSSSGAELIHIYGPDNSWSADSSMGGAHNVFVENNIFTGAGGSGQATQGGYNARVVFRYNNISNMKFDMHGLWSNGSPAHYLDWTYPNEHSARHCEVYNNAFTSIFPWAMELRGGTGVIYNNTIATTGDGILLRDYCTFVGTDGNCARCMCLADYPLRDQIGRGKDQTSEPMYLWHNTVNGAAVTGWTGSWSDYPQAILFEGQPSPACVSYCGAQGGYNTTGSGDTMANDSGIIQESRDYYIGQKPGYAAYPCPHPLTGLTGTCDPAIAGISGYNISGGDSTPPAAPTGLAVN